MAMFWTITASAVPFIALAIMTFFSCCSTAWFRGNREHDNIDDNDPTPPRQPHHQHFRNVDYGTYDGPAPATHHGDGEASTLASQVSPRTTPTNTAGTTQDASSSVYPQPITPPTPPQSDTVTRAKHDSSPLEAVNAPTNGGSTYEHDALDDADLLKAMKQALNKIAEARMGEGTGDGQDRTA